MASGGEDGVDGIAFGTFQEAAAQVPIAFHVADHWFDGAASFEFSFDGRAQAVRCVGFLAGDEHLFFFGRVVSPVSAINVDPLWRYAGDPGRPLV